MSWKKCAVMNCPHQIRAGLRRHGEGGSGQELADGFTCWRCRAKRATPESRKKAKERTAARDALNRALRST